MDAYNNDLRLYSTWAFATLLINFGVGAITTHKYKLLNSFGGRNLGARNCSTIMVEYHELTKR